MMSATESTVSLPPPTSTSIPTPSATPYIEGEDTSNHGPPEWVAMAFLFVAALVLGGVFILIYIHRLRNLPYHAPADPEATRRRLMRAAERFKALESFNVVLPSETYKHLKAESKDGGCLPDQTGSYVVCVICLEPLGEDDQVRRLPCHHVFHAECIDKWFLKRHYTCPLCVASYYTPPPMPIEPQPVQTREVRSEGWAPVF